MALFSWLWWHLMARKSSLMPRKALKNLEFGMEREKKKKLKEPSFMIYDLGTHDNFRTKWYHLTVLLSLQVCGLGAREGRQTRMHDSIQWCLFAGQVGKGNLILGSCVDLFFLTTDLHRIWHVHNDQFAKFLQNFFLTHSWALYLHFCVGRTLYLLFFIGWAVYLYYIGWAVYLHFLRLVSFVERENFLFELLRMLTCTYLTCVFPSVVFFCFLFSLSTFKIQVSVMKPKSWRRSLSSVANKGVKKDKAAIIK